MRRKYSSANDIGDVTAIGMFKRLLKQQGAAPKRMIASNLGTGGTARKLIMPNSEHRSHKVSSIERKFTSPVAKADDAGIRSPKVCGGSS